MKSIYFFILFFVFLFSNALQSQTATDAFRFSQFDPLGSGRNLGVGNSMYSIGADLSAIGNNPAGIGAYWRSEFMGSMDVTWNPYESRLKGDSSIRQSSGSYDYWRMPNLGFVITHQPVNSDFQTSNWAIGYNRVAEYAQELQFSGYTQGSITDSWSENSFGRDTNQLGFDEALAYSSGAIYDFEFDNVYETDYQLSPGYHLYKEEFSATRGGNSEFFLGYGANLSRKFLFGLSLNFPLVNSDVSRVYSEIDNRDGTPYFNELHYTSYVNTSGYGINGKFGFILKPSKYVNLSFAAQTPTKLHLTDNFNSTVTYDWTDQNHDGPITTLSPYGNFYYALRTPWKLVGGIAIIAGTNGFLSAGVQWIDYSSMRFDYNTRGNGNAFYQEENNVNASIHQSYSSVFQLNMGGEIAFTKWRIRGGFSAVQSPYNNDDTFTPTYHGGIGYRAEIIYVDMAYTYSQQEEGYLPYETNEAPQPVAVLKYNPQRIVTTIGLKF